MNVAHSKTETALHKGLELLRASLLAWCCAFFVALAGLSGALAAPASPLAMAGDVQPAFLPASGAPRDHSVSQNLASSRPAAEYLHEEQEEESAGHAWFTTSTSWELPLTPYASRRPSGSARRATFERSCTPARAPPHAAGTPRGASPSA